MRTFSRIGRRSGTLAVVAAVTLSVGCTGPDESTTAPAATGGVESAPGGAPAVPAMPAPTAVTMPAPTAGTPEETVEQGVLEISQEGDIVVFVDTDVTEGPAPLTVTFEVELEGGKGPIQWRWNYGDGQTGSAQEIHHQHTFAEPGTYRIELEVEDADGETDFDLVEIVVSEP